MKETRKNPFFLIVLCMLLMLLSQTVVSFAVVFLNGGALFQEGMTMEQADALMLDIMLAHQTEILLISGFVTLVGLWLMAKARKRTFGEFTGIARPTRMPIVVLALAAGVALSFWASIAVNSLPWPEAMVESYVESSSTLTTDKPVIDFLAVVLMAPLVEELLFRGVIYDALCLVVPAGFAVVFQAMLFGSTHNTLLWMLYSGLIGCVLGYVRKRSDSLWPCIVMHSAFNGSSYLFTWFAERYSEDTATVTFVFLASAFVLLLSLYGISFRTAPKE
ncbi:MAG: CPBP family intramembrane metalloprotease [Clostridia bacterium]|nr:CPBP family intramembrane metalloprotease [Clostridia bacterium]